MSLAVLAQDMASKGRNGDSMLVHMTPGEVAGLHALALKHGGELTINPDTGLPEANFLKSLLPIIAGFALGPAGFGLVSSALGASAIVGGITGLATGSLSKGLMAGLGAYGGFGIGESLMSAGTGSLAGSDILAQQAAGSFPTLAEGAGAEQIAKYATDVSGIRDAALSKAGEAGFMKTAEAGLGAIANNPAAYGKDLLKFGTAAAAPIMADQMVQTTTQAPVTDTGNIRKFSYDPYSQRYTPQGIFPAAGYKGGMAGGGLTGGIVALAGGFTPQQFKEQMYAGGADDTAATRRGLELASQAGLNATDTTNLWNQALGTKFTPDDYAAVMRQYNIAAPTANTDFVKSLATDTSTAADFGREVNARGLSTQDVNAALASSGLSGAAQFALTNQNIGSDANTAETYGGLKGLSNNINYWLEQNKSASANDINNEMKKWDLTDADFKRATGKTVKDYTTVGGLTDSITGGAGTDSITGGAGTDSITGGGLADLITTLATNNSTANDFITGTAGLDQTAVTDALKTSGLSGAAQFALTHTDIGSDANTDETYGGLKGLSNNINYWLEKHPGASAQDIRREMAKWDLSEEDFIRATGTDVNKYAMGPITEVQNLATGAGGNNAAVVNENGTITQTALGNTNVITNADGTKTVMPTRTVDDITNLYTQGGGSTGYVVNAPKDMPEFNTRFNKLRPGSDSESAYKYLMGQGAYPTHSNVGEIMKPYNEAVLGIPQDITTKRYLYDNKTRRMVRNPEYVPMSFDTKGVQSYGLSQSDISKYLKANNKAPDADIYSWAVANNVTPEQIAEANNADIAVIRAKYAAAKYAAAKKLADKKTATVDSDFGGYAGGGGVTGSGQLNLNIPLDFGGNNNGYSAVGSGLGGMNADMASRLGAGRSNNVAQSGLPDFRSQIQGFDAKIQQLPSVTAYNDYGKSITGRPPTADEMAQMDKLRGAIQGDKGYTDLQYQMQSLGSKYQQQAMGNQSSGLQQRYMQQSPNVSSFAEGGLGSLGSLGSYSDGGRLLKGPGDGVSDSIPATIGRKQQPARLADGEFVVPARIVSELGNGSTDAGAKKLYAMMDRVQRARGKTTGKNKVAANSRADKYLPA